MRRYKLTALYYFTHLAFTENGIACINSEETVVTDRFPTYTYGMSNAKIYIFYHMMQGLKQKNYNKMCRIIWYPPWHKTQDALIGHVSNQNTPKSRCTWSYDQLIPVVFYIVVFIQRKIFFSIYFNKYHPEYLFCSTLIYSWLHIFWTNKQDTVFQINICAVILSHSFSTKVAVLIYILWPDNNFWLWAEYIR